MLRLVRNRGRSPELGLTRPVVNGTLAINPEFTQSLAILKQRRDGEDGKRGGRKCQPWSGKR